MIKATFERRMTQISSEPPDRLTDAFAEDPAKIIHWTTFKRALGSDPNPLPAVRAQVLAILMPPATAAAMR